MGLTDRGGDRGGSHAYLLGKVEVVHQAEAQRASHAADLGLASGLRTGVADDDQRAIKHTVVRVPQPFDTRGGERCDRLDAQVEEAGGSTRGQVRPRRLAGKELGYVAN